jgi:hypothetical protein
MPSFHILGEQKAMRLLSTIFETGLARVRLVITRFNSVGNKQERMAYNISG